MKEGVMTKDKAVECLKPQPQCTFFSPCMTLGSGIGRLTAHEERRINAKLLRPEGEKRIPEQGAA